LATVDCAISKPSLSSSPPMRGAPQSRAQWFIRTNRYPPKAEVASSNLAGSAIILNDLTVHVPLPKPIGETLGSMRNNFRVVWACMAARERQSSTRWRRKSVSFDEPSVRISPDPPDLQINSMILLYDDGESMAPISRLD
jgi:hypothetical protein